MKDAIRSDSTTRRRQAVPWWKAQFSLFEDPPPTRATDNPPSEPDRPQPVGCADSIPEEIRNLYVEIFGLPALHPANRNAASREVAA